MTSQPQSTPRTTLRVPFTPVALVAVAVAGFAGGALAFRGHDTSADPPVEPAVLGDTLSPYSGVGEISSEEFAAIQRQVNEAFMEAYLSAWPGGMPQALPVPPDGNATTGPASSPGAERGSPEPIPPSP